MIEGPVYPTLEIVLDFHRRLIERDGGLQGVRDPGGVEAALARPEQLRAYGGGGATIFTLAAALGFGFACIRHPFVDGNKRVAATVMGTFLYANGYVLDVTEADLVARLRALADHDDPFDEGALADWLRENAVDG